MDHRQVYETGARAYQALVAAEDIDGNLAVALREIISGPSTVIEIGAGTGRVTRLLRSLGHDVTATEPARAMLEVAVELAVDDGGSRFCQAEAAYLPICGASFDVAVAGWVFGHQREWNPAGWRDAVGGFLTECERVTGEGLIVIVETLGTGHPEPNPPVALIEYYDWLEGEHGFSRKVIRTDYAFPTVGAAATIMGQFFGPDFARIVERNDRTRVPECTGIWVRPRLRAQ